VPVLKDDDAVLFESNAIAEFLDEMIEPRLHPLDPVKRARNRAWARRSTLTETASPEPCTSGPSPWSSSQ